MTFSSDSSPEKTGSNFSLYKSTTSTVCPICLTDSMKVSLIAALKDLLTRPIDEVTFNLKSLKELNEISNFLSKDGDTLVRIKLSDKKNEFHFQLKNKRHLDRKTINLLRNKEISSIIS